MLNIEGRRETKPIKMDLNIILDAGIRFGTVSPYQRSVRWIVDDRCMRIVYKTVKNINTQAVQVNNAEKLKK